MNILNLNIHYKRKNLETLLDILLKHNNIKTTGVVLAMDLTSEVLQSAIKNNCNLILSHHPFLFEEHLKDEDVKAPYKREIIKQLRKHQITSYSLHTNYDETLYGILSNS
ncbi:Nif3-like dinuclear metal center hexameric protein [Mycoplasmopsis felis]|uniref:Nif3-like dinuclear metal center hexameric protein n=1 Tax=Mycoplasmopsis felis TaxID=33923 RepID=UPI0021DF57A8|nr:Nif3-like dinuclear metal center hexameric protein [Mycoplasmopsis felis]MCU9939955.1 Nif3-like dinuclear metal center hexameric protein [Mycoplasmopsis felis]